MPYGRNMNDAVLLPNGQVIIVNGARVRALPYAGYARVSHMREAYCIGGSSCIGVQRACWCCCRCNHALQLLTTSAAAAAAAAAVQCYRLA
jgi:hypothetical protein